MTNDDDKSFSFRSSGVRTVSAAMTTRNVLDQNKHFTGVKSQR